MEASGPQELANRWNVPEYESLYGNPRWEELLERAGVSQQQLARIQFEVPLAE